MASTRPARTAAPPPRRSSSVTPRDWSITPATPLTTGSTSMTSGRMKTRVPRSMRLRAAWLALLLAAPPLATPLLASASPSPAAEAAADAVATEPGLADWILAKLARPAPMRTPFVELRGAALLKAPLRLQGEYRRPDAGTLVREVRSPYPETTTIRAGEVAIARNGGKARSFSLSRA